MGATCVTTGEPNSRNGASSASARSGSVWQTSIAASFIPDPSGACTRPANADTSSGQFSTASR